MRKAFAPSTRSSSRPSAAPATAVRMADIGIRSKCASITLLTGTLAPQLAPTKIIAGKATSCVTAIVHQRRRTAS